ASGPLVIVALVVVLGLRGDRMNWPRTIGSATPRAIGRQLGPGWLGGSAGVTAALLVFSVFLPLERLGLTRRTWAELPNLFRAAPEVIWNSVAFAAAAATVCVLVALVTWRLPVGLILWLPFLVPGVLLGRAMLAAFSGTALYGTTGLVILSFAVRYLALGWNGVALARGSVDRDLGDAARLDGAGEWGLLRHAHWPEIARQVGVAWYVTYLLCLWDVETLVLIYPPGGETLALRLFNLLHYGHSAQVNALCLILLALAVAPLVVRFAICDLRFAIFRIRCPMAP
ncbi:MAG TPA: hypothetical protein VEO53_18145, partial [Candidatus Binatia bacterium]|nr:hypothetical protein [Candidatus Binatia bacterium]